VRYASGVSVGAFSNTTLLLVAHGSTVNAESATAPLKHAAAISQLDVFADVRVCFWKQPPFIRETFEAIQSPRVFVVPLFLSDGYFTQDIIPRELGLRASRAGKVVCYTPPIGTSARMTDVILSRAAEAVRTADPPPESETALVLAAHGTEKNSDSRGAAEWHAGRIRGLNRFAEVHAAFMEEEPRIIDITRLTRPKNIIVVPFFISDGLHAREDVPVLLGEEPETVRQRLRDAKPTFINPTARGGKLLWYSSSIGTAPLVTEVIMDRVREAGNSLNQFQPGGRI
jgi:sirohydrochlorin cobaltochelatase